MKSSSAKSEGLGVDVSVGAPVAQLDSSTTTQSSSAIGEQLNQFSRSESTNRQNTINDRKSKSVKKTETMVAEMTIEVMRYQARVPEVNSAIYFLSDY